MQLKNARQAGVTGRYLPPGRYWTSPEGKRRKELQRLHKFAARPSNLTPRLMKNPNGRAR